MIPTLLLTLLLAAPADSCRDYQQVMALAALGQTGPSLAAALAELREAYPACDRLYLPSLRNLPSDAKPYDDYFFFAAQDPLVLGILLEHHDRIATYLPRQYENPLQLLQRFIWSSRLPAATACPCGIERGRVHFRGYIEEMRHGCYTVILFYTLPPDTTEHAASFSWSDPRSFGDAIRQIRGLMKQGEIPLIEKILHRGEFRTIERDKLLPPPPPAP